MTPRGPSWLAAAERGWGSEPRPLLQRGRLFLGRTPLVERRDGAYVIRPQGDLERLLSRAYQTEISLDRIMPGLTTVASALNRKSLCLAQIVAVQLRLLDLSDAIRRLGLEAEDLLIKREQSDRLLARAGWNEAEHPRAGTPPNPGRFAPQPGSDARVEPTQTAAQRGRGGAEAGGDPRPAAPVRQAVWDARIAVLRRIDPNNPNLTYFANLGSAPSQAALDRLDAAIEAASLKESDR